MVVPARIGRYEVLGQLATGGMAEILLARLSGPSGFSRPVVIKRMLRQLAGQKPFIAMFLDEARTMARIRHPNVVQILELGDAAGESFLVLEYVAGENLSSVLRRCTAAGTRIEPALAAHIVAEACAGLHAAHELVGEDGASRNLVHRDVSPQNLFVDYEGHVKLLDFGVARTDDRMALTQTGEVKGKFDYMSPEQVQGRTVDRRSDLFAMGVVLYELVTGRRLFHRRSHLKTIEAILKEPVVPPSRIVPCPPALEEAILRALAKDPAQRFATAAEMRLALLAVAREMTSPVETLAGRMRALFGERIAEKNELLRKVREGQDVANLPAPETDELVAVPDAPAGGRSHAPLILAISAVVIVLAIGGAAIASRRRPTVPVPTADAPSSVTAVTAPSAEAPTEVVVQVASQPPGARVIADGEERGQTPLELRFPRGSAEIRLELHRAGFVPLVQTVVPDTDQKLVLALSALQTGARARPPRVVLSAPPPPLPSVAPPPTASFRRFD